ncbi:FAD-dependent oxidoreductase [Vulcanisaeta sp. JCM 14467]|uniref:FAD-dependent oxidoreductase n=1 Tax=Vulcanisaeta sp. JCM 14467 TaxID=1295370 RepID=UPI0006D299A4|nr:FAD-dependent oxidoreductase [Vulcanisaeta sp. JCM 14467]
MSGRPWIVEELNRGNYGVMRSSRYGEPRGFLCCEWWCEGYWASSGYYDLCNEKPTIPGRPNSVPSILKGLASPSSFPRNRLLISLWPLIRNTVRNSLNRSSINELPSIPEKASRINVNADVLIVGGGPAGLSVAKELNKLGLKVVLIEGEHYLGGHLIVDDAEVKDLGRGSDFIGKLSKEVSDSVTVLTDTVFDGFLEDAVIGHSRDFSKLYVFNYRYLVLAQGFREVPLVFPGNGTPRMMTGLTILKLIKWWGFKPRRVLVWGSDDWGVRVAMNLAQLGIETYLGDNSVIVRSDLYRSKVESLGIKTFIGMNIVDAKDSGDGLRLILKNVRGRKAKVRRREEIAVDVLVSAVRVPVIDLPAQLGAPIVYAPEIGGLVPRRGFTGDLGLGNVYVVGDAGGLLPESLIIKQARITALSIGSREGLVPSDVLDKELAEFKRDLVTTNSSYYNVILRFEQGLQGAGYYAEPNVAHAPMWAAAGSVEDVENALKSANRQYLCFCEDVTLDDVLKAVRVLMHGREIKVRVLHGEEEEYKSLRLPSMERIKRVVGLGTGPCQGKFCLVSTNLILSFIYQKKPNEIGLPRIRFPEAPIPMATLAGGE